MLILHKLQAERNKSTPNNINTRECQYVETYQRIFYLDAEIGVSEVRSSATSDDNLLKRNRYPVISCYTFSSRNRGYDAGKISVSVCPLVSWPLSSQ